MSDTPPNQEYETLLEFPCNIDVRVMGSNVPEFRDQVIAIAKKHDCNFNPDTIRSKNSKTGKYVSLTLDFYSENKACLEAIYLDLKNCELVQWTL